jgi:hypothetical protein
MGFGHSKIGIRKSFLYLFPRESDEISMSVDTGGKHINLAEMPSPH